MASFATKNERNYFFPTYFNMRSMHHSYSSPPPAVQQSRTSPSLAYFYFYSVDTRKKIRCKSTILDFTKQKRTQIWMYSVCQIIHICITIKFNLVLKQMDFTMSSSSTEYSKRQIHMHVHYTNVKIKQNEWTLPIPRSLNGVNPLSIRLKRVLRHRTLELRQRHGFEGIFLHMVELKVYLQIRAVIKIKGVDAAVPLRVG